MICADAQMDFYGSYIFLFLLFQHASPKLWTLVQVFQMLLISEPLIRRSSNGRVPIW